MDDAQSPIEVPQQPATPTEQQPATPTQPAAEVQPGDVQQPTQTPAA